eukprot:4386741-Prymnesium_polylepis.1
MLSSPPSVVTCREGVGLGVATADRGGRCRETVAGSRIDQPVRAPEGRWRTRERGGRPDDALTRHPEQCKRPRHLQAAGRPFVEPQTWNHKLVCVSRA